MGFHLLKLVPDVHCLTHASTASTASTACYYLHHISTNQPTIDSVPTSPPFIPVATLDNPANAMNIGD